MRGGSVRRSQSVSRIRRISELRIPLAPLLSARLKELISSLHCTSSRLLSRGTRMRNNAHNGCTLAPPPWRNLFLRRTRRRKAQNRLSREGGSHQGGEDEGKNINKGEGGVRHISRRLTHPHITSMHRHISRWAAPRTISADISARGKRRAARRRRRRHRLTAQKAVKNKRASRKHEGRHRAALRSHMKRRYINIWAWRADISHRQHSLSTLQRHSGASRNAALPLPPHNAHTANRRMGPRKSCVRFINGSKRERKP